MFTKVFVKDALERAIKAFGASGASVLAAGEVVNLFAVNWTDVLGVACGSSVVSVLLSLASYKAGRAGTASAVKEVTYAGDGRAL